MAELTRPPAPAEAEPEGLALLRELPGPQGALLWGALRDVMRWAAATAAERADLFGPGAAEARIRELRAGLSDHDLLGPLLTLVLMAERPADVAAARVLHACRRVARWAERAGAPATRQAFTEALARAQPLDARLALEAARGARELGRRERAEAWYSEVLRLARGKDGLSCALARIGLCVQAQRVGDFSAAAQLARGALADAQRHRLDEARGMAHQELVHLAARAGGFREAIGHARAAMEAYGERKPKLAALAGDLGRLCIELERFEGAAQLFDAVLPLAPGEGYRAIWAADLVWAAGAAGLRGTYEAARERAVRAAPEAGGPARTAESYLLIARGDLYAGERAAAGEASRQARALAAACGADQVAREADGLAGEARNRRPVDHDPSLTRSVFGLVAELMARVGDGQPGRAWLN